MSYPTQVFQGKVEKHLALILIHHHGPERVTGAHPRRPILGGKGHVTENPQTEHGCHQY